MINMLGNDKIRKTRTGKYHWQILDDNREVILQSFKYFKKEDDAKSNYREVLNNLSGLLRQRYGADDSSDPGLIKRLENQIDTLKKEKLTAEAELGKRRKAMETHKLELQEIKSRWSKYFGYYALVCVLISLVVVIWL